MKRQIAERQVLLEACKKAWEFLSRFQVGGVKYDGSRPVDTGPRLDELTDVLANLVSDAGNAIDGVLLLIDEADKPAGTSHLGQLCKLLTERLSRRNCEKICLGLSGLPDLIPKLKESHESAPRIFHMLTLAPLEGTEREAVIERGLDDAEIKNGFRVNITSDARRLIANLSEGYPHFLQEFAHCAFESDSDNNIDANDVWSGTLEENGALDQLGKKYFSDLYIDQIGSEDYRKVLTAMAEGLDAWINRRDITKKAGVKQTTVDNALRALKQRKIIVQNPRVPGEYKLPTASFAVWIRVRAAAKTAETQTEPTLPLEGGKTA